MVQSQLKVEIVQVELFVILGDTIEHRHRAKRLGNHPGQTLPATVGT